MNHFVKNSWTRLASTIRRRHLTVSLPLCSHFSGNNSAPESWSSMEGLVRCPANDVPLSPVGFLERAAKAYTHRTSLIYGSLKFTWGQTHHRCLRLASALTQLGISPGDVVSSFIYLFMFSLSFILNKSTRHKLILKSVIQFDRKRLFENHFVFGFYFSLSR